MAEPGWKRLLADDAWQRGPGKYPIPAYSEFMPPPRLGWKPYGEGLDPLVLDADDPWGWRVSEYEEALELQPGLMLLAKELLHVFRHLGRREPAHGIARHKLHENPYWPEQLRDQGAPSQERYVMLLPLALSRTQDDKGRVRWTLFGASEQGPGRPFWRSFFTAPRRERPAAWGENMLRRLLVAAYGEPLDKLADLRRAGFRIYTHDEPLAAHWREGPLPSWTAAYRWQRGQSLRGVRYLLTFCPFAQLPPPVQRAYLSGELHLLPFPGSLALCGVSPYLQLSAELPLAEQVPLLHSLSRHEAPWGIRIPQSGWLHEPRVDSPAPHADFGPLRNTFRRTHRWARVRRHEDELAVSAQEDKMAHVLFSAAPADLGLYGKPMARNTQIWDQQFHGVLDGPRCDATQLARAAERLAAGGMFGYRLLYPPMLLGRYEVFWQRPLVAYFDPASDEPRVLDDAPNGYLTAYPSDRPRPARPAAELWPRLLARGPHQAAMRLFTANHEAHYHQTMINVRKILDAWELGGRRPLARDFARQLLTLCKETSLDDWLASLPGAASDAAAAAALVDELQRCLEVALPLPVPERAGVRGNALPKGTVPFSSNENRDSPPLASALTLEQTSRRSFETAYWKMIATLATGRYVNKDNADCVHDPVTKAKLVHHQRDLEALGDFILKYYERVVAAADMTSRVAIGELPFQWQTDFPFEWSGGWSKNQASETYERDLITVIPGRNRRRAVIMADHYDTAYMEDVYGYTHGGGGPRLAAAGADDNHSATAALMLGAPHFLRLAREGRLACDIWLVHLTGEEFPSDCMGARHLCQKIVEGGLRMRQRNGRWRDLSRAAVEGVYVLDMIAHNIEHDRDVFQICPGSSGQSLWLARQAQAAAATWNARIGAWNGRGDRRGRGRGKRSADGRTMPEVAQHPHLYAEIRPHYNPRSTLYNTDGQIFSDAGVPVVLFMENYDINRHGYHDTQDTLANIDLDYGAAVAAIAIESVARAATTAPHTGVVM